jgi:hypothetical protein
LLGSPAFLAYALATAFANAAWYAFVAGAPYVMVELLGLPPIAYGKYVLIVLAGYILGNFLAGRLSVRMGGARMIAIGQGLAILGAGWQVAMLAADTLTPLGLFLPMTLIVFASGLFLPNTNAGALSVHPQVAGSAAHAARSSSLQASLNGSSRTKSFCKTSDFSSMIRFSSCLAGLLGAGMGAGNNQLTRANSPVGAQPSINCAACTR